MTSLLMFFWENIVAFSQVLLTCKQSLFSWSEWCSQSLEEIIAWQVRNATDALLSGKQGSQQRSQQLKGSIITLISGQGQCVTWDKSAYLFLLTGKVNRNISSKQKLLGSLLLCHLYAFWFAAKSTNQTQRKKLGWRGCLHTSLLLVGMATSVCRAALTPGTTSTVKEEIK